MRFWLLFVISLLVGCSPQTSSLNGEQPFYAPDFTLDTLTGDTLTLSEQREKWVIVNFWATWCAPCREEMPTLQMIDEDYPDVQVLAVNVREKADLIQPFVADLGLTFPILLNPDDKLLMDYQVIGLPQTLVINPEGQVVAREFGIFDVNTIFQALER